MTNNITKKNILHQLQKDIFLLQGFRPPSATTVDFGLGPITAVFPNAVFPTGTVHEFLTFNAQDAAASGGFIAGLLAALMRSGGVCVWISSTMKPYPPALKSFGVEPDQVIFVLLKKERDVLWCMEEALKQEGLAAVVGETQQVSLIASRRLQLAVEKSHVTGFMLRHNPRNLNTTASAARWKITPLASEAIAGMPGPGFPRWTVELLRVRNGVPGIWQMEWSGGRFHFISGETPSSENERKKIG